MINDNALHDNPIIPLAWVAASRSSNGSAGRPFPTVQSPPEKPRQLPHAAPKSAELPRLETPEQSGLKGGEEEC